MENLVWIVYLVDVVCTINYALFGSLLLLAVGLGFVGILADDEIGRLLARTLYKRWLMGLGTLLIVTGGLTPSTETAYKMLAIYSGVELLQSEEAQQIGGKSLEVLNKVMDEYLEEVDVKN